jgi:hypothetical protein
MIKEATLRWAASLSESLNVNYFLQFLQEQLSPQLQFSQEQLGLSHFRLSFAVV